jgi:predicted deacetylase
MSRPFGGDWSNPELALLVSIHDVSPLTLDASRRMVDLAVSSGIPLGALTLLLIPYHDDSVPLDEHSETCAWLREVADAGACLCLHGFTHRMTGRLRGVRQWAWGRGFARGQAEFFLSDAADCTRRLDAARAIVNRAGFGNDTHGFVPPAWMLSPAASDVIRRSGFAFHEQLSGIISHDEIFARRLVGFGSHSAVEAACTARFAWLQCRRSWADTRFAIHPADMLRGDTVEAIKLSLTRLKSGLTPMNYMSFLRSRGRAPRRELFIGSASGV